MLARRSRGELRVDENPENMEQQPGYGISLWKCLRENFRKKDVSDKADQIQRLVTTLESRVPAKESKAQS